MENIAVSVIIPIFNVAKWISRCVESLMQQTIKDKIEFIFIDDCSRDNSVEIAKAVVRSYPNRHKQCVFIHHDKNLGLPAARNTGLKHSKGDYIFHCDSDDYVEPNMLELMIERVSETNADYVWCDWFLTFSDNERLMKQPKATTSRCALSAMLNGSLKYNVWNKLVKRSLYIDNNIFFPENHSMGEDMTMIWLLAKSNKVASINRPLYHYIRVNQNAISQRYDERKLLDLKYNVAGTISFLRKNLINDKRLKNEIDWFMLNAKLPFLFTGNKTDVDLWKNLFRESNNSIWSNKSQSLRSRLLQLFAKYNISFINIIYSKMVHKFIYGKIFK